jgi:hypothetical protein
MQLLFSPNGGCESQIVDRITSSDGDIQGLLFMYQSEPIHNALLAALDDARNVSLVMDRRQQWLANPRLDELIDAGGIVVFDKVEPSIRSQYLIVWPYYAFAGSYLYSYTSELRYAEILIEMYGEDSMYNMFDDWLIHYDHSEPS